MKRSERIREALKNLYSSSDTSTRVQTATALGNTLDPQVISPLTDILHNDPDWEVRTAAYLSLAKIPDETALIALIRFYSDLASAEYREGIDYEVFSDSLPGSVLRLKMGAFPILHDLLSDANPHVRGTAVWLLAEMDQIDGEQLVASLAPVLRDEDSDVRSFAMFLLQEMDHPSAKTAVNDYYREVGMDDFIDEG